MDTELAGGTPASSHGAAVKSVLLKTYRLTVIFGGTFSVNVALPDVFLPRSKLRIICPVKQRLEMI